jgi:putative membrane protein
MESDPTPQPDPHQQWMAYQHWLNYANVHYAPRKLHWASIPLEGARVLRELAILVVIVIALRIFTGRTGGGLEFLITVMGLLRIVGGVWRYLSTSYQLTPDSLLFHTGAVFKQNRSIPLSRIQNINITQGVLHRLFKVAEVRIETATGGGQAEVALRVVSLAEAEWLRATLLAPVTNAAIAAPTGDQAVAQPVNVHAAEPSTLVHRTSFGRLLLLGATSNRASQIIGAAIALMFFVGTELSDGPSVGRALRRLPENMPADNFLPIALAIGVGVVLMGWLLSIVLTVVTKFGFELRREPGGRMGRSFGLFTRHHAHFPKRRVQMLRIESTPLQRKLGYCRISVETAGSFNDEQRGATAHGTPEVCPIVRQREAPPIIDEVLAHPVGLEQVNWQRVSRRAIGRAFLRIAVLLAAIVTVIGLATDRQVLWGVLAVPFVAIGYALLRYRALGYALTDRFLLVRGGIWTRVIRVVPRSKVQASFVKQSPIQRFVSLATFRVLTAGTMLRNDAVVPDMEGHRAKDLQNSLHRAPGQACHFQAVDAHATTEHV